MGQPIRVYTDNKNISYNKLTYSERVMIWGLIIDFLGHTWFIKDLFQPNMEPSLLFTGM